MSCHPGPGCTGHTPGTTTTALPSPRAGPEPGSQGTQSRECRHGGSPSPMRVLSNPPHVDPPAAKVRRRVCDVSVRPTEVCTAGDQFSTQETKHCWNQGSALEMKKKGKTEALSSLPQGHVHSKHPEVNSHTDYVSPLRDLRTTRRTCGFSKQKLLSVQVRRGCLPSTQNTRNWGRPPPAPDRVGTQAGRQDTWGQEGASASLP